MATKKKLVQDRAPLCIQFFDKTTVAVMFLWLIPTSTEDRD